MHPVEFIMHRFLAALQAHVADWEDLEAREMMSASPLPWHVESPAPVSRAVTVMNAGKSAAIATVVGEPVTGDAALHYASFANDPLFAAGGRSPNDVRQGELGDCYLLASLSSLAQVDPSIIRNDIALQPDGTYSIGFQSGKKTVIEKVDTELPVMSDGQPAYAQLGAANSLWAALMEKAFAEFRNGADSYANLNGGWMGEVYGDFGLPSTSSLPSHSSTSLLAQLQADLRAGKATTVGTPDTVTAGVPLVADHAYSVASVNLGANGKPVSVTLRNPWGFDGAGNDGDDDGYVTLTAAQVVAAFSGVATAAT